MLQDSVIDDYNMQITDEQIDFYGQQDYGERYESILSNTAHQQLKNPIKKLDSKEFSRAGAKQENFNKTGKQVFDKQVKKVQQPQYGNKSDMGFGSDEEALMEMEMSAGIGNPDINRNLGIGMRGQKELVPTQNRIQLGDVNEKSKTTNIQEILQQVNKKSKSTKHQVQSNGFEVNQQRVIHQNFGKIKRNSFFEQQSK